MNSHEAEVIDAVSLSAHHSRNESHGLQRAFSILLFTVFVIVDLLALMVGASSYGSITAMQTANDQRITTLGPLLSNVRANDMAGGVASGVGPEGRSLVLVQSDAEGTYETRVYLYEGKIMQEFALAGSPYTPSKATALSESSTFDFSYDRGLLTIRTDAGNVSVALRNLQGGAT